MDLKEKRVVVTGATGGIGRELVKKLDEEGADLILVSKSEDELKNLLETLKGSSNSYYVCDLSNQEDVRRLGNEISSKFEKIDIFISAAGIGVYKPIGEASLEEWNTSMNINVTSNFILFKNFQENLEKSSDSLVLIIGSGAGVIPMATRTVYCSTKFALRGLTLSLAEEYKRIGNPKFCLITLGSTLTSFGPMSYEEKEKEMQSGKAYFTPEWVGGKITEIIKDDERETENVLYPSDYGLGNWP